MKAAALNISALAALLLLGLGSGLGAAQGSGGPVGTATSVVSSVGSQTGMVSSVVTSATGASSDPSGNTGGGAVGGAAEGAGAATGALRAPRIRTTFDRLPRRLEITLERIVVGPELRANLRRLERALRAAPPRLRVRILRLLRAEMQRLERGGLTQVERRRYRRLGLILEALTHPGLGSTSASSSSPLPAQPGDRGAGVSSAQDAPNATGPDGSRPSTGSGSRKSFSSKSESSGGKDRDVGGFGSRLDLSPAWEWHMQLGIYLLLLVLLVVALAALLLAAVPADALPTRRLRRFVRTSRVALAMMGTTTLITLALILFL
jgi:hypothetical protein